MQGRVDMTEISMVAEDSQEKGREDEKFEPNTFIGY